MPVGVCVLGVLLPNEQFLTLGPGVGIDPPDAPALAAPVALGRKPLAIGAAILQVPNTSTATVGLAVAVGEAHEVAVPVIADDRRVGGVLADRCLQTVVRQFISIQIQFVGLSSGDTAVTGTPRSRAAATTSPPDMSVTVRRLSDGWQSRVLTMTRATRPPPRRPLRRCAGLIDPRAARRRTVLYARVSRANQQKTTVAGSESSVTVRSRRVVRQSRSVIIGAHW